MKRYFNITGCCNPQEHYMVNLDSRLAQIKKMVDRGQYFCINRGRQYGKTTLLDALQSYLQNDYTVISMDFQAQMSAATFENERTFSKAFIDAFIETAMFSDETTLMEIAKNELTAITNLVELFRKLSVVCKLNDKKIVLMIDEVDSASNNQVFLDFLAQLRGYYLIRNKRPTFQSVILAGVHDIRNLRQKIRPDAEHKHNSPWNIASNFDIDMSFSVSDIAGMLTEYEQDHHTGMDIQKLSQLIYDYTSGYPVLVSSICKYMDEKFGWKTEYVSDAVKLILKENNALFESLINKIEDNQELYDYLYQILILGRKISYNPDDSVIRLAMMYGFLKEENGSVVIANRIFETRLYNAILTTKKMQETSIYKAGEWDKNQFIQNGQLNMEKMNDMERYFNITGCCNPQEHYMVNLDSRLAQIKKMVDRGQYFCINRGRQYGKTTLLDALQSYLQNDYTVISMDFQAQMSAATFENERTFSKAFIDAFIETAMFSDETTLMEIAKNELTAITNLVELFRKLSVVCKLNDKKIVLMIDEVDSASNNQVFLDFLAQLRGYYLIRNKRPTFQSVILAGVHDIRNLRQKIRPDAVFSHAQHTVPCRSMIFSQSGILSPT